MEESGFPPRDNKAECIIHRKKGRGNGNDRAGGITRTIPMLGAPNLVETETETERGKKAKTRRHHLHKK
jgi:hypothetical protein